MAMEQHLETYQSYSADELDKEIGLLKQKKQGYLSQQAGGKSYTQDLTRVDDMLAAAIRVKNLRGPKVSKVGRVDYSNY